MWKLLLRDRVALAVLLVGVLLWAPFYSPFVARPEGSLVLAALQATALVLAIGVCLWGLHERPERERRFWTCVAAGLTCWLGVHALEVSVDGNWAADLRLAVIGDTGYLLLYLALILALELRPHVGAAHAAPRLRILGLAGALVFTLSLFAYFVVVSVVFDRATYFAWTPSSTLWALFDAYLLARLAILAVNVGEARWRAAYGWMGLAALGWATLDGSDLLQQFGLMAKPMPAGMLDTLWFVTPLFFALAVRVQRLPALEGGRVDRPEDPFRVPWSGPLLANAIVLPLVHALVLLSPGAAPALTGPRHVVAFSAMVALLGMTVLSLRWLAVENRRLAAERAELGARARLGQRLEALGRLAGGVAHDFNNLLQVIRLCGEGLREELDPRSSARLQADEITLATERAMNLTSRLLTLSREQPAQSADFDLNHSVGYTVAMLRRVIGEQIRLEVALDPRAGTVAADRAQLELALLNLGVNARDAQPKGGRIRITTSRRESGKNAWAVLEVTDDGAGMDEATRTRIFEPFFTTKRDGRGTGLGLTLVKSFVEAARGRLEVESAPGRGTTFRLLLPVAARADTHEAIPACTRWNGSGTALVVEDERAVRSVLCGFLQASGFQVLEAADGVEALELLSRGSAPPTFVLTDLTMPRMGGLELARRLHERHPELPVLYMTGYAQPGQLPDDGESYLLRKPFSRIELDRLLREALATVPSQPGSRTRAGVLDGAGASQ